MESRPRSRLRITELRPGSSRRGAGPCCPDGDGGGGGADRISGFPDDVLLHVLARLRCARAAAHASLISRRWRGLWRQLPELSFRDIAPGTLDAALAQVARTELSLLDIDVTGHYRLYPADVASLLRAAARLAPAELRFAVWGLPEDRSTAVEVPCFHRATSVKLSTFWVAMALPEEGGGGFPVAERLSIDGCRFDFGALISRCPRLRLLEATRIDGIGALTVRSPTIESLHVQCESLGGIDVVAPMLKKFSLLSSCTRGNLSASFYAPMVRNFHWDAHFRHWWWVRIGAMWCLCRFSLRLQEENVYCLHLRIEAQDLWVAAENVKLKQKIAQFPYFSILQLSLVTRGHIYGAAVLNVLEVCTDIKRLRLVIYEPEFKNPCPQNCRCDQPYNWRDKNISLAALEEVEIKGFEGAGHEVDLLKLILRCAPMLKVMTVILSDEVSPCISGCEEIRRVLMACPSLKWSLYPQPL